MGDMTQTQFFILLGTVLAGVIWQRVDTMYTNGRLDRLQTEVNGRIDRFQTEVNGRIDRISDDMKHFYQALGQHDARLDSLESGATDSATRQLPFCLTLFLHSPAGK